MLNGGSLKSRIILISSLLSSLSDAWPWFIAHDVLFPRPLFKIISCLFSWVIQISWSWGLSLGFPKRTWDKNLGWHPVETAPPLENRRVQREASDRDEGSATLRCSIEVHNTACHLSAKACFSVVPEKQLSSSKLHIEKGLDWQKPSPSEEVRCEPEAHTASMNKTETAPQVWSPKWLRACTMGIWKLLWPTCLNCKYSK